MKKTRYLLAVCLIAAVGTACAQTKPKTETAKAGAAKGDAAKGKTIFEQQCELCHDATTTDRKMGPGLKELFKRPKLSTNGKPTTDANVLDKIDNGGNGMTPYKEMLSDGEKADLLAYLKTL